jgi:hypothetical protein
MVILRPTRKLSSLLPATGTTRSNSDTALGDWYINRIVVDRQPLLLLVSSASLLTILVPARDVRNIPIRLAKLVKSRLGKLDIEAHAIDAETNAMMPVEIAPTVDRSVLGIMVDFAKLIPCHLEPGQWNENTIQMVEERLAETPCHAGRSFERVIFPKKKTIELLRIKWPANTQQRAAENTIC